MKQENELTRDEAILYLADQLDAPTSLTEFTERVLSIWTSKAKNPQAGVRQEVRDHHQGKTIVFLDDDTIVSTQMGLSGVQVRLLLSRQEIKNGLLSLIPNFQFLRSENIAIEALQFVDVADHIIPTETTTAKIRVKHILGDYTQEISSLRLGWWYKKHKIKRQDYLLLTILDWSIGKFRLQHEAVQEYRRNSAKVEESNRQFADMLFAILEASRYEFVLGGTAVPTAYARLKDQLAYPPDHWSLIIQNDPRMQWDGYMLRYAEEMTFMERLLPERHKTVEPSAKDNISSESRSQVYRFKAYLKYRKGLWRRIEIQGGQTFAELDEMMRSAFQHDFMDHLSGFWQRIRRGNSRRFREVELATVTPFGERGEGADQFLANLDLKPGDTLKYVYDFGDWIEHYLELEAIDSPEDDIIYPRIIAQNKPRYKYCPTCQEKNLKTIATHICIWCSNDAQEEIIMCEDCIDPVHEEHYLEEILY